MAYAEDFSISKSVSETEVNRLLALTKSLLIILCSAKALKLIKSTWEFF